MTNASYRSARLIKIELRRAIRLAALLLAAAALATSCKPKPSPPPQKKAARWVAQYRSPASAKYAGSYLVGLFAYNAISVVSSSVVFVAADYPHPNNADIKVGVVLRTTDGGQSWTELDLLSSGIRAGPLNALHFVNSKEGWVVGKDPIGDPLLVRTTDGGDSWVRFRLSVKQTPSSVFFTDSQTGWMGGFTERGDDEEGGGPSDLLATTDGGATWRAHRRLPVSIADLFFADRSTGWATGYGGSVYQTTDAGLTWETQRTGLEGAIIPGGGQFIVGAVCFAGRDHGWVSARADDDSQGILMGTTDGGKSWSPLMTGPEKIRDLLFVSQSEGWTTRGLESYIYHTTDGGLNWEVESIEFDQKVPMYRLGAADALHVWAVGGGAIFFRVLE